ncbi:MAG TPA: DHA2 family efflux MFS transporter permease subunit [Opitutaceae bacterium]|jgi:DHA2 family multidrug resistance protein|nr:DHA2 family efflux MFS transporter permease subunit [Opitutaceae bacterium]
MNANSTPATSAVVPGSTRAWIGTLGGMLGAFMAVLDIQITNASIRDISGAIGATLDESSWISIAYLVPEIIVIPLTAWIASILGLRRYLIITSALFLVFSALCGQAWSLGSMIVFRAGQGFFGGALIPLGFTAVLQMLPPARHAIGFALFGLSAMFAPSIGPSIGGWLTDNWGWQWNFYLNLLFGPVLIGAVWYGFPSTPARWEKLREADGWGILLMALGLGALTTLLEEGTRDDWFGSAFITRLAVIAAVALPLFVIRQLRAKKPVTDLRLFAVRNFGLGSVINLVLGASLYGSIFLLPLYLGTIQGYGAADIGATLIWGGMPQLLIIPLMPWFMKRFDVRWLIAYGLLMFGVSCLLNTEMSADFAHDQLRWSLLVRSLGQPFILVPVSALATAGLPAARTAAASGLFNMVRNLGGSIGIALLSALLTVRERLHSNRLGEAVSAYNPLTHDRLAALTQKFMAAGSDAYTAGQQAVVALDAVVRREATLMAFNDCFHVLGFVLIGATLAAFLCRPAKAQASVASH